MLISSAVSSSSGIISATSTISAGQIGVLGVITLIILLSLKEVLSASGSWNKNLKCSLDMSLSPLLIAFIAIVVLKISMVVT